MRVLASTFLTTALVSIASIASAQPAETAPVAAPAPSSAPQNYNWNDVCHINGQLVGCGESNGYLKPFKKTVIATDPIGLLMGDYTISVSHALGQHIAVRGEADYIHLVDDSNTETELSGGVPIYFRRTFQGGFVEPGFAIRHDSEGGQCSYDATTGNPTSCAGQETVGPQVLVGWQWTWDSGFDVAVAAGVGRNLAANSDSYSDNKIFPNGYFKIGYAF